MQQDKKNLRYIFAGVAGCIILYWILFETERLALAYNAVKAVLSPFVVGAVLAFILNVPMRAFEKMLSFIKKAEIKRTVAVLLTLVAVLLILSAVIGLLIPQIVDTVETILEKLPVFFADLEKDIISFLENNPEMLRWFRKNVDIKKFDLVGIATKALDVLWVGVDTILDGAIAALGGLASAIINAVISLVFAIYCLFRKEILARQGRRLLYAFFPEKFSDTVVRVLRLTNSTFSNFLSGQCLEVCILGCMFAISMAIFDMPYIPLVSVLVAVTAFIPIVGAFAGCAMGALFILVDNPIQAVWFVAMFLVLQQIENNLIYPRVVGTSIGLPGMWVLLAVAVGGEIMGVAGMFLMIPLAAVMYVVLREVTTARLEVRGIAPEKLTDHPPVLQSHFKARRERRKKEQAKAAQTENNTENKT